MQLLPNNTCMAFQNEFKLSQDFVIVITIIPNQTWAWSYFSLAIVTCASVMLLHMKMWISDLLKEINYIQSFLINWKSSLINLYAKTTNSTTVYRHSIWEYCSWISCINKQMFMICTKVLIRQRRFWIVMHAYFITITQKITKHF